MIQKYVALIIETVVLIQRETSDVIAPCMQPSNIPRGSELSLSQLTAVLNLEIDEESCVNNTSVYTICPRLVPARPNVTRHVHIINHQRSCRSLYGCETCHAYHKQIGLLSYVAWLWTASVYGIHLLYYFFPIGKPHRGTILDQLRCLQRLPGVVIACPVTIPALVE